MSDTRIEELQVSKEVLEDLQRIFTRNRRLFSDDLVAAVGNAIMCIERDIPKQPSVPHPINSSFLFGYCPLCSSRQSGGSLAWHKVFNKRCDECGQVFDWSDVVEDKSY